MKRSSSNNRSFNKIIKPTININEINNLKSFKSEIVNTVKNYIDKMADRDLTLSNLKQISEKLKSKISIIS